jgi:hypothetical protein
MNAAEQLAPVPSKVMKCPMTDCACVCVRVCVCALRLSVFVRGSGLRGVGLRAASVCVRAASVCVRARLRAARRGAARRGVGHVGARARDV